MKIGVIFALFLVAGSMVSSCLSMPDSVEPVGDFELERYLGKWYEIARLDHWFERGLNKGGTAEYSLRKDGGVRVLNRGYSVTKEQWKESEGRAYFVGSDKIGHLKVSFFGPFFGSYVIFELDHENYQYAFVSGSKLKYLWLLSRTPKVAPAVLEKFVALSKQKGFDTDELIYIEHE